MKKLAVNFLIVVLFVFGLAINANAAPLNWSFDQTIDLSSPDINLIIKSGSGATSLAVNTGSVSVVVPSAVVFTLTSANRTLSVSGNNTSSVLNDCAGTLATVTITGGSGGETITITPGPNQCGGGGSSSGSRPNAIPATPAVPVVVSGSPADCLPGFLFSPSTGKNCNAATPATPAQGHAYAFGQNTIKLGSKGGACKAWQTFLNDKANAGLVIDGWCGKLTIAAAKVWQASKGLTADGLLGPMSRAKALVE